MGVQAKLANMRRAGGANPLDLLIKSNLIKQLGVLGLQESREAREGMRDMVKDVSMHQQNSAFDSDDPRQVVVAERCFDDLSNFSKLRDPQNWGPVEERPTVADLVSGTQPSQNMLRWAPERIAETLTVVEPSVSHLGLRNFANVMRCMGDKPAAYIGNKEEP